MKDKRATRPIYPISSQNSNRQHDWFLKLELCKLSHNKVHQEKKRKNRANFSKTNVSKKRGSRVFRIIISPVQFLPSSITATTNYRGHASFDIRPSYSSAINRDLYGATITFTLDTRFPPSVYFNRTTVLPSQRRNQCAYPQSHTSHTLSALAPVPPFPDMCIYIYIFVVIRDSTLISFRGHCLRGFRFRFTRGKGSFEASFMRLWETGVNRVAEVFFLE